MISKLLLGAVCVVAACVVSSCGGSQGGSSAQSQENVTVEEQVGETETSVSGYDIERIKSIKSPTEADNDFLLDQYELVCQETKGMTPDERKTYLMKKGDDGKVLALMIMGVENSRNLTEKQKARLAEIQEKYK